MIRKKQIKGKKFSSLMKKRLLFVFFVVCVILIILSIVIIKINMNKGEAYSKAVYDNFTYDSRVIPARRGDITDRNGTILAYSTKVYNLILDSKVLLSYDDNEYRTATVSALLKYFDIDEKELNDYLDENKQKEPGKRTAYKRMITDLTEEQITDFNAEMNAKKSKIKGVWFEEEYKRNYPYGTTAAELIGFASEVNGGELGLENYYEKYLAGTNGREYGYIDNSEYETNKIAAVNGNTIVSTIDYNVQNIIEKAIKDFNDQYGSETTSVIVMDPNNGEILGMADYPTFDLSDPRNISSTYTEEELNAMTDEERVKALYSVWSNSAVSKIYEPGSVFKTFTVAEVLEENLATLKDVFTCDGEGVYDGSKILCHGGDGHGDLTVSSALTESCNDVLMQFSELIGKSTFSKYLDLFKFGQKTGIDLPSEEAGLLIDESKMMDVDLATNSFGQNLNVTMVQMTAAFASIINGGYYYEPHTVKEIQTSTGETIKSIRPLLISQTVSSQTSALLRTMLRAAVDYGTGGYVYSEGYSIGGKTGTAEKQPRDKEKYIVSFMGFAPAENPDVLIYVIIDSPECDDYNTSWAAQVLAKEIFDDLLPYMNIYPDNPDYETDIYLEAGDDTPATKREVSLPSQNIPEDGGSSGELPDNVVPGDIEAESQSENTSENE